MRSHNVFGKKLSKMRPFYLLLILFIIIIPAHFVLDYFQDNTLESLQSEEIELRSSINQLLEDYQQENEVPVNLGMIYSGFEYHHFDYYLEEEINLYLDLADLSLVENKNIQILTDVVNPFTEELDENISIRKIELEFTSTSHANILNFLEILIEQDQLFYVNSYEASLLNDNSFHTNIEIYAFYLIT